MLSGGAPLSPETHEYIRTTFSLPLVQGYGLTESCACACIMDNDDNSVGSSGTPLQGVRIKLVNWPEGGYSVTDKPAPRGEIIIGGDNVATGYYKMAQKSQKISFAAFLSIFVIFVKTRFVANLASKMHFSGF